MKKQLLYIILLMPVFITSCNKETLVEGGSYMQLNTRAGEDSDSDKPCFIFWKLSDFSASGFDAAPSVPYVYSLPEGMIDTYNTSKYNTGKVYPPYAELVYAVGVSPASIPGSSPGAWKTFSVDPAIAGLVDIQCAPVISGHEQTHFSDPLRFAHQLAKLEFKGYCGASMKESESKFINVKDIKISIRSDVDDQWEWFPEKLTWNHGGIGVGQYKVSGYTTTSLPASPIIARISSSAPPPGIVLYGKEDIIKAEAKPIGHFYLVPGFDKITIKLEATYIDTTGDGNEPLPENGQENNRVWEELVIGKIHSNAAEPTIVGHSYTIFLGFERSKIILGVTLKDWEDDIEN